jgi:putative endopeptidase
MEEYLSIKISIFVTLMKRIFISILVIVALTACNNNKSDDHTHINAPTAFDPHFVDSTVSPCENFYKFAIGNWQKENPVPETESRWMAFNILNEENRQKLLGIMGELDQNEDFEKGSNGQLIRDFYRSGMDTNSIEAKKLKHIKPILERIDKVATIGELNLLFPELIPLGIGTPVGFYISRDDKNSERYITNAHQTGLSLPDRDYYLKKDEKNEGIRAAYVTHVNTLFGLAGLDSENMGETVLKLETQLATAHWTRTDLRDPDKGYNLKGRKTWDETLPNINITGITNSLGMQAADTLIVGQPSYYEALNGLFTEENLSDWKTYLKWKTLSAYASFMGNDMEMEDFNFFGKILSGKEKMKPRNERILGIVEGSLGQPLGKLFVEKYFPAESKQYMENMIENLREAYRESIHDLTWMTAETKEKALKKLNAFTYKIGYPEEWKDYSTLEISEKDFLLNAMNTASNNYQKMVEKLGNPVDKKEWFMNPQMVNAYYSSSGNEIVFPAGILQPPFFHPSFDKAINYGGIGAVIGHEFTHGFDDQGSKYDWDGNLNNWWTDADRTAFERLSSQLANQYSTYSPVEGMNVNGEMTLGENIADLGGLTLAFSALKKDLGENEPEDIDGFNWKQRFFLGWASVWKGNITQKELQNRLITDYHSPAEYRVIGPLSNFEPFNEAFGVCEDGQMYKPDSTRIKIW